MSAPDYARIRAVFHQVCELAGPARDAKLDELCAGDEALRAEVMRLLRTMDEDDMRTSGADRFAPIDPAAPPTVAGYRVTRLLGEGGMGAVYEAEQERPHRRIALKVIRAGFVTDAMLRRFQREAEILGRLKHPAIAQIYEVGVATIHGRETPYLAMELVEGRPLLAHADAANLSTRQRLELARRICDAVEHAHQRGVIHRDLKPANILVTDAGEPKILDFGIARITDSDVRATTMRTEVGQILGTAAYMSPEQASGDPTELDTRSDVYALGVVIFELLSGQLPHSIDRLALPDAIRVIRESEPTRISSIRPGLRGDVETILSKAMEREKQRRYQSASELGADIHRHLTDEAIVARPGSAAYQLRKFARRNRAIVGGACAVFLALSAGLVATGAALAREASARAQAEDALQRAGASATFLERVFTGLDPSQTEDRDTELLESMLDDAAANVASEVANPGARAEILSIIGRTYTSISRFEPAALALEQSLAAYESLGPDYRIERNATRLALADPLADLNRAEQAEALMREALADAEDRNDESQRQSALRQLAELRMDLGDWDAALEFVERAVISSRSLPELEQGRAAMLHGAVLRRLGRTDEAAESYSRALSLFRDSGGPLEVSMVLNSLGIIARAQGRLAEAEALYRESLDLKLALDDRPTKDLAISLFNYGRLLHALDRLDEAADYLRQSVDMHRALFTDHFAPALPLVMLAGVERDRGDVALGVEMIREALNTLRAHLPPQHPYLITALSVRGSILRDAGDLDRSEASYREAIDMTLALDLDRVGFLAPVEEGLAATLHALGRSEEAAAILRKTITAFDDDSAEAASLRERIGEYESASGGS